MTNSARLASIQTIDLRKAAAELHADVVGHRLFVAGCAAWFAALFALGSLAAGGGVLTGLVRHLHLAAIVPAAAPPLGTTARLFAALVLGGMGGLLGLVIARQLAVPAVSVRPQPRSKPARTKPVAADPEPQMRSPMMRVRGRDAHPDAPPRRPLVVTEDVLPYATSMGIGEAAPAPFETVAPVVTDFSHTPTFAHDDPLFLTPEAELPIADIAPIADAVPIDNAPVFASGTFPVFAEPDGHEVAAEPLVTPPPLASLAAAAPHTPIGLAPLASLGLVQLIERLALAIAARQARRAATPPPASAELPDPDESLHLPDMIDAPLLRSKPARAENSEAAPLAFGSIPAKLRDPLSFAQQGDDNGDAADLGPRFLGGAKPGAIDQAAEQTAEQSSELSAAWIEFDGDSTGHTESAHGADEAALADDAAALDDGYASLAAMSLPRPGLKLPIAPAADHDQPADPVIRFPQRPTGIDAPSHGDADQALRDALATLRRMSGGR